MRLLSMPSPSHLSYQKESSLFLPAIHFMPFLNTDSPFLIAAHVDEQVRSLKRFCLLVLVYLWDKTLAQRESFSWWKHKLSLTSNATFFSLVDWRPSPPFFFGSDFQPANWVQLLSIFCRPPNKIATQSINVLSNLDRERRTLHGVVRDGGESCLGQHNPPSKG